MSVCVTAACDARAAGLLCVLLGISLLLTACAAAGPPRAPSDSAGFAGTLRPAPAGYRALCERAPDVCRRTGATPVALTVPRWRELLAVNDLYNTFLVPMSDMAQFGVAERWDVPRRHADCEDYALAKQAHLAQTGWPRRALRLAVVDVPHAAPLVGRHAVLLVLTDRGVYVLDSRTRRIEPWTETPYRWVAIQSNEDRFAWYDAAAAGRGPPFSGILP